MNFEQGLVITLLLGVLLGMAIVEKKSLGLIDEQHEYIIELLEECK